VLPIKKVQSKITTKLPKNKDMQKVSFSSVHMLWPRYTSQRR